MINTMYMAVGLLLVLAGLISLSIYLRKDVLFKSEKGTIDIGNAQYIGTREKQDDSFGSCQREYGVVSIVADGIGGFVNGDIASKMTVETFLREFKKHDLTGNVNFYFQSSAQKANFEIRKKFEDTPCGTTVVVTYINRNQLYWFSVGDSNIAVYRNKRIIPVNRKENVENWLEEQYLSGKINKQETLDHPQSRRLMNYVGYDGFEGGQVGETPILLQSKDIVLLYSDGVEVLSQIQLEDILSQKGTANDIAEKIIEAIKEKKVQSKDNATVIVIKMK